MSYRIRDTDTLVQDSIYVLREVKNRFDHTCILWSGGKDSTTLIHLCKEAFYGEIPFDVVFIDTGKLFPETYEYVEKYSEEWGINLVRAKRDTKYEPGDLTEKEVYHCCMDRKTNALKDLWKEKQYDSALVGIRFDEEGVRSKERVFSPRTDKWEWRVSRSKTEEELKEGDAPIVALQEPEMWNLYQTEFKDCEHVRVHPLLHWFEIEIWEYLKVRNIPVNPLYLSKDGKRYRSLGCNTCTFPIESNASTIEEIQVEIYHKKDSERSGRVQKDRVQERLRYLGYMSIVPIVSLLLNYAVIN